MSQNERISQLEEVAAEMLHKQDIITADIAVLKADLSAQRTAQLRTMQVVMGMTESITLILDKIDGVEAKVDGLQTKVDGLQTQVNGVEAKVDNLQTQLETYQQKTDAKLDLILDAVRDMKK